MKYDLLIFSKAPKDYGPVRINKEAKTLGLTSKVFSYARIDFEIEKDKVIPYYEGELLPEAGMVVFRAAGGDGFYVPQRDFLLSWYEERGSIILNKETYKKWPRLDKIAQHFEFQKAHLPFIESRNFGANSNLLEWAKEAKYPFIIKHNLSSQGRDVSKITSYGQLEKLLEERYRARTLLVQEFLPSGEDLRVIVIGRKVFGAMKRIAQPGKYLTNYSVGGIVENYDITKDPEATQIAEKAAEYFSLDYVGVDLMKNTDGKWKVLEINRACQFEGFEKATKLNVAKETVSWMVKNAK